ncbi:MAG: fibro-slime domain-containing protein [Planctomycetota bacterium]|jgi:fibro-slime domain-containing protein
MTLSTHLAITSSLGMIVASAVASGGMGGGNEPGPPPGDPNPGGIISDPVDPPPPPLPQEVSVMGIVRDFQERTAAGGHEDFEFRPISGFGLYVGNVSPSLGSDGKPVFTGQGHKITSQWRDAEGRSICYRMYRPSQGDTPGTLGTPDQGGIHSAESFAQWYTDVPGVNLSALLPITFQLQPDDSYVFDDTLDPEYIDRGGFFPIDDELFGNSGGSPDHNFHFTFELHMQFEYRAGDEQFFKFIGDDDVWVFIDGDLVIDLGGVHGALEQHVELNRLELTDGETYPIHFFFAERHRTQSNFRIETNIPLSSGGHPAVTKAYD